MFNVAEAEGTTLLTRFMESDFFDVQLDPHRLNIQI
jgi:hypothetical protein